MTSATAPAPVEKLAAAAAAPAAGDADASRPTAANAAGPSAVTQQAHHHGRRCRPTPSPREALGVTMETEQPSQSGRKSPQAQVGAAVSFKQTAVTRVRDYVIS